MRLTSLRFRLPLDTEPFSSFGGRPRPLFAEADSLSVFEVFPDTLVRFLAPDMEL